MSGATMKGLHSTQYTVQCISQALKLDVMITRIHGKDKYELSQAPSQEGSGGSHKAPFLGTPFSKKY